MPRRAPMAASTALVATLSLACSAAPLDTDPAGAGDADAVVVMDDLFYAPDRLEVPAGEPVVLLLENEGGIVHDLVLDDGWSSGEVAPGRSTVVELPALTASTVAWCSIPGHRDAGMQLELIVTDAG